MKSIRNFLSSFCLLLYTGVTFAQIPDSIKTNISIIRQQVFSDYKGMFRKPVGILHQPFITPGSNAYANDLWDWDSWLSNIALRQILEDHGSAGDKSEAVMYERGCILNYLDNTGFDGYMPILIAKNSDPAKMKPANIYRTNMHKPVIAQHAAFLTKINHGDAEWLREKFSLMQAFINNYESHHRNRATGLYYWQDDLAIGTDNDPSTFFRPNGSSGSIFLNCLMYKELNAMVYLAGCLKLTDIAAEYSKDAENLKLAVQKNCWDEKDGYFYSVDLNLKPVTEQPTTIFGQEMILHSGFPRNYDCLIQRIGTWSGFMAMWAGIATPEQAKRMVVENLEDKRTFNAQYGIRTLSKLEKMYSVRASNNPSNWLGPIWGISNYMTFRGLVKYGFKDQAKQLAFKTIMLFGKDYKKNAALHEYYEPDTGEPILNKGFQNWNYLVINMIDYINGEPVIEEF
ncbi:glycosyl hydrolase family 63 [Mucilaginibacter gracilis]|uniref:Glycoside hydrolase family 37 n=2 Tax=Mucilaginibacter TaxID=423349 RepID=H1YHQ9_9SPHI|nr:MULTISPECIES: trehalase family glycosidase [Mucilaginibacter]EHQ27459.1 glycoside hydrolase family 37 [Mucilaginibacter paludis DSM 18603]RKR81026.1 glycosyl hydrolase family 63 [Mucilaginibacter gracilis]